MGLKDRIRRLEDKTDPMRYQLVYPECEMEFTVYGDAPLELIAAEWLKDAEPERYEAETEPGLKAALAHEHRAFSFLDKRTGRPVMKEIPAFRD